MSFETNPQSLAVDVHKLSRSFRGNVALDQVSLQIPVGSVFGLVGLNGAGKTTLIRHLIGSFKAQSGTVRVMGLDPVADPVKVLSRVGYLTEEDSLPTWMRVGELVDFARGIYSTWDEAYAAELIDMFGLSRSDRLRSLSKGLRARAGLLVAIAHRPELLILDEPSSGLDPLARRDILEAIIRAVNDEGRTVLFSSHLLDEVERVCDTVALMRAGQIIETTTVEEMERRYEEVTYRADSVAPPNVAGVIGWQRKGNEWSGVMDANLCDPRPLDLPEDVTVVSRREIRLESWFAARAGRERPSKSPSQKETEVSDVG
ncbi:ABC transporter ATP-binding protein [Novipirellula artificiosorum]|uniref:ABC transporter ATP-binding protein YtrB n=1 Tax=Novipirellula artificiosorum TaxID=2528016 RepID=A0A5C6DJL9_9BACT|nr:ABC transporter ATP-binding protein [Novipirellula artificiosorum]TWU37020.1 ABC transporter ATP-binding protein YtrB [Novipirellula artificiosorum]